jgi:hypothetical protein
MNVEHTYDRRYVAFVFSGSSRVSSTVEQARPSTINPCEEGQPSFGTFTF